MITLIHSSLSPASLVSYASDSIESCIVDLYPPSLSTTPSNNPIRLVNIYRSPNSSLTSLSNFLTFLSPHISSHCIITGDLNMPSIDWTTLYAHPRDPIATYFLNYV